MRKIVKQSRLWLMTTVLMSMLLSAGIAQALQAPLIVTAEGNCSSILVGFTFDSQWDYVDINLVNTTTTANIGSFQLTFPAQVQFDFNPPLEDGTTVLVTVDAYITNTDEAPQTSGTNGDILIGSGQTQITVNCETTTSVTGSATVSLCNDGRTNINLCEPIAIYPVRSDDGTGISIYHFPRGATTGSFELYIPAEDLAALPTSVDTTCTIAYSDFVVAYLTPSGHIQIHAGPDEEGKIFIYRYAYFPSTPATETYFDSSLPIFEACN